MVCIHLIQLMSLEFVADNRVVENVITSVLIFAITTLTIVATTVQHDLVSAPGTDMSVTALVNGPSQASSGGATLRSQIAAAMPGVPFSFQSASWSDPLGLVPGALPASPTSVGKGNTALLQAASMTGVTSHATLIAGRWPTAPAAGDGQAGGGSASDPGRAARLGRGAAARLGGRRAAPARPARTTRC